MAATPTVLFCVGATKAGTSWLHRTLSQHSGCHIRSIKELHYFDALENDAFDGQIGHNVAAKAKIATHLAAAGGLRQQEIDQRLRDRDDLIRLLQHRGADHPAYLEYLCKSIGRKKLVADFTPAYGLLPEGRLKTMAGIAPDVRFIYLLRDPTARLWSHVRMTAVKRSDDNQLTRDRAGWILDRVLAGQEPQISRRSDYRGALEKLRRAVAPERLLISYYEDLFHSDGLARICEFLGITPMAADRTLSVNAGQPLAMLLDQRRAARDWLAEQYDYVRAKVGNLPTSWHYDLAEVPA